MLGQAQALSLKVKRLEQANSKLEKLLKNCLLEREMNQLEEADFSVKKRPVMPTAPEPTTDKLFSEYKTADVGG